MPNAVEAAALIASLWQEGTHIQALPPALRPSTRLEGYAVQAALCANRTPAGWKIAATSKAGQQHIGVSGPLAGRLFADRVVADGGRIVMGGNNMQVAEVEFAFRFARDLPPRPAEYTQAEVLDAVGSLHPAIEVPASRFDDFVTAGEAQLIADNACADWAVIGAATAHDWRSVDLSKHEVTGILTDAAGAERTVPGIGANALGDPRIALTWLANEASRIGTGLRAGEVVITGTCVVPMPVAPGMHVVSDLGVLGRVAVSLV